NGIPYPCQKAKHQYRSCAVTTLPGGADRLQRHHPVSPDATEPGHRTVSGAASEPCLICLGWLQASSGISTDIWGACQHTRESSGAELHSGGLGEKPIPGTDNGGTH